VATIKSKLEGIKPKIGIAHPLEDALSYMEQIIRMKEEWPLDRIIAIKKVMAELDIVMEEVTNTSINPKVIDERFREG
jgi:hypothetical protein